MASLFLLEKVKKERALEEAQTAARFATLGFARSTDYLGSLIDVGLKQAEREKIVEQIISVEEDFDKRVEQGLEITKEDVDFLKFLEKSLAEKTQEYAKRMQQLNKEVSERGLFANFAWERLRAGKMGVKQFKVKRLLSSSFSPKLDLNKKIAVSELVKPISDIFDSSNLFKKR